MNLSPQQLAAALGGEVSGSEVLAPGPGHSPKDRSLSIKIDPSAPDGFVTYSFAGDDPLKCKDYVRDRAGVARWEPTRQPKVDNIARMSDRVRKPVAKAGSAPATYIYKQADGRPYLRVVRPGFYQSHWDGSAWINGAPKGPKIPYRLPEIIAAGRDGVNDVVIVEGEKDADNLAALGFIVTTNSAGAEKWTADLNPHFAGRNIYILPDNDEPGERHAALVARELAAVAQSIRVVRLPGLPEKGDVSDWIEAGGGVEQLAELFRAAPEAENAEPPRPIMATPYEWRRPEEIARRDWIYGNLLIRKFVTATVSPGGVGKSSLIAVEALAKVSGRNLLGVTPPRQLRVWLWNLEDPQEETERKIQAAALHYGLSPDDIGDRLFVDSGREQRLVIATTERNGVTIVRPVVDAIVSEIIDRQIDAVIIDPFVSCHEVAENDNTAQDMVVKEWGKVADRGNCAVHLVDHTRKMGGMESEVTTESARGAKSKTDACRVVRAVNRMSKEEGERAGVENSRLYFRTYPDKANLAPPADKSDWFRLQSVDLPNGHLGGPGDSVGVVTTWKWPDPLAGMTSADFDKVAAVIKRGQCARTSRRRHGSAKP
jgi:AAA domain